MASAFGLKLKSRRGLVEAALEGDVAQVTALLDGGADPNQVDDHGHTALIKAVMRGRPRGIPPVGGRGNLELLGLLCDRGADPNRAGETDNTTPIQQAAARGLAPAVRLLLDRGADPNQGDLDGETALMWSSDRGHLRVVRALLERGAAPNQPNRAGWTAAMCSTEGGHIGVLALLAVFGADLQCQVAPAAQRTVCVKTLAGRHNHPEIALFEELTRPFTPIQTAVYCRMPDVARLLLRCGWMHTGVGDGSRATLTQLAQRGAVVRSLDREHEHALAFCPDTLRLVQQAAAGWSPAQHWLHGPRFREAVRTMLLVSGRLQRQPDAMPGELWVAILRWMRRSDWLEHTRPPTHRAS